MNESHNPFAEPITGSRRAYVVMQRWFTVVALAAIAGAVVGGLAFRRQAQRLDHVRGELGEASTAATRSQSEAAGLREKLMGDQSRLSELNQQLASDHSRIADLEAQLASNQAKIAGLENANETANQNRNQNRKGLEEQMRAELQSRDVTISQLQGKLTVNILDRILFNSGEAVLQPGGEAVLRKIAAILKQHSTLKIHVIGHTDNVPIRANSRSRFATNWELSTARALAAVRFLTERADVDPHRVGAVGWTGVSLLTSAATVVKMARKASARSSVKFL